MKVLSATLLVCGGLVAACSTGGPITSSGVSHTRVLLTDAPFPYDDLSAVNIYIVSVEASSAADSGSISDPSTWATIAEPHRAVNVLALTGGTTEVLGETDLSAGVYRAVRVTIDVDSSTVLAGDGTPVPVLWQASGRDALNALVESPIDAPEAGADIVLDFDLARCFQYFTDPGDTTSRQLVFIPWIRAVNAAATGSVTGMVTDPTASPVPIRNRTAVASRQLPGGGDSYYLAASSHVASDGSFALRWLTAGHYRIAVEAETITGLPYVTDSVFLDVVAGQSADVGTLLLHPDTLAGSIDSTGTGGQDSTGSAPDSTGAGGDTTGGGGTDSTNSGAPVRAAIRQLDLRPAGR
ncbi:MAG TPA: DUF4382 domain-containing protein [Gemmatimonadales bacterium]|nr:DUF4382 domain-containing protein [Gemmatimonadales bacterium]